MGKSKYNSVDELPDLSKEPVYQVDTETKKVTRYNNVDELPDLKKKVGSLDFGKSSLSASVPPYTEENNEIPTFTDVEVGEDPIALARKANELKSKRTTVEVPSGSSFGMGTGTTQEVPDDNAQFEYSQIKERLKKEGYDADKLAQDFSDIPDNTFNLKGFTKGELMDDYKNNPQLYERKVGTAKWQSNLLKELNKEGNGQVFANVKTSLDNISNPNIDYNTKRNNIQDIVRDINTHGGENKKEILRNLSVDLSNVYAEAAASSQIRKDNPLFDKLNSNQLAAYQLLEDTNPQEANRYKAALLDDKAIEGNFEAQLQKQEAGRRLDEMGIMMQKSYANEKLNPIIREYEPLLQKANDGTISPAEQARMQQLEEAGKKYKDILDSVAEDEKSLVERYPKASYLDANNFAQELIGQKHSGLDWMAMEMGKATDNTAKGLQDLVTAPFRSEQNNEINQAEVLGGSELSGNSAYLKQGNQTTQSFKPEIEPELQKQIDAIKDNDSLTKREKLSQVTDLLMENGGKWRRAPIEGGKTNIGLSSLMYGVGGLAANLAPFMALELGTGGGASATALRKFTSAFTSAAATGFHDSYVQALEKGSDNPFAEAARVTAINSAAMAGAGTPDAIRKMLGNKTAVGKLVSGMTDDAIELALKAEPKALSNFKKAYESVKNANKSIANTVGENLKTSSKLTAFTTGGQIANDAISGELKSPNDYAKQAAIETLKFTILGTAGGMLGKISKKPSSIQLASLHEAGRNPEAFMKALEAMEKDGSISPTDAQQVRTNVEKVAKIFKSSPIINKLNENQKREYIYNQLVKLEAKEAASNLPPKQAEKADMTAMVADKKNELILEPKNDEQLQKEKERLEKILEPKKDAEGKTIELPEQEKKQAEAELQAITEIQKENEQSKGKPEEISQPIELSIEPISKGNESDVSETEGKQQGSGVGGDVETTTNVLNETQKNNPTVWQKIKDAFYNLVSKTKEYLNKAKGTQYEELAKVLGDHLKNVRTSTIEDLKGVLGEKIGGQLQKLHILVNSGKGDLQIFFHEAMHHITFEKINQYLNNNHENLKPHEIDAIQNLQRIFTDSKAKIEAMKVKTSFHYGFTNLHEFISEAFSNPEFQRLLKELPSEGKHPTVFKAFLDAIAKLMGLKDATILNDIFHHTEKLLDKPKSENEGIAELYHQAKAEGTHSDFVKAVEQSIPTQEVKMEQPTVSEKNKPIPKETAASTVPVDNNMEKVNRLIFDRETGQPLDGSDETMAEQLIEKAISKSKDTDQANAKLDQLGYNLRGQANADFNQFVQDRIDGKTDMTFSEWKNQSENKPIQNEPIKEPASSTTVSSGAGSVGVGGDVVELSNGNKLVLNKDRSVKAGKNFAFNENSYDVQDKDGNNIGNVHIADKGDYYQISNVKLKNERTGLGTEIYKKLITELDKPLISDKALSEKAKGLWDKLVKEGVAEKFNDTFELGGKTYTEDRYRTLPTKEAQSVMEVASELPPKEKVKQLRAEEQAEYDALPDPNDKVEKQKIYDKYDKLISPLLEEGDGVGEVKAEVPDKKIANESTTKEAAKPVQQDAELPEQQGNKKTVQQGVNAVGQGNAKAAFPVLKEKSMSMNAINSSDAKKVYREVNKMDTGTSAEKIALQYIAGGGKVGGNAINEVAGSVKKASLNIGRREKNTAEVNARDYYKPNGETLDEIAHKLWEDGAIEGVTTMDIKNALMDVISSYNTRLDAAKAYLGKYSPEYIEKQQQEEFYQQYKEEVEAEERAIFEMLEKENTDIEEAMADEDYVTKLIEKYEAENEGQNQQSESETETAVSEGTRNKESASNKEKVGKYEAKAKAIAEKIMAAKVVPDWLKIDDENISTNGSSAEDLKKVLADAVINMGKLLDKGVEFSQAIKESVKGMIDIHGEGKRKEIEEGFEKYYRENEADVPPPKEPNKKEDDGSRKSRKLSLLKNLMGATKVPEHFKKGLEEKGLEYEVSNQAEAQQTARGIIDSIGREQALDAARDGLLDPSVGSAVFGEAINDMYSQEAKLRSEGKNSEADLIAQEWADTSYEYAKISNSGGKWNSQIAYFYKSSPMGIALRQKKQNAETFADWFKGKEDKLKEVFEEIKKTEQGKSLIDEEVEKLRKEERKSERSKRRAKIEKFFDDAKFKGDAMYSTIIPPKIINAGLDVMKEIFLAGETAVNSVSKAIEIISKELGNDKWDKDKFRTEWEGKLRVMEGTSSQKSYEQLLKERGQELKRRIDEKDFSAEEYKEKKNLNDAEKAALEEFKKVKEAYDEEKKKSPEWKEKKAKQYLDNFRKRMEGMTDSQRKEVIRRSIRQLSESGALRYDDFKKIIAETIGIKEFTEEQIKKVEKYVEDINAEQDAEDAMVKLPSQENNRKYVIAREKAIQAQHNLYNLTNKKSDIVSTIKSWITGSLLSIPSLIKNVAQGVLFQSQLRFPTAVVRQLAELGAYGLSKALPGSRTFHPKTNLILAQKGYFSKGKMGIKRGAFLFNKGLQERDFNSRTVYQSTLSPKLAARELQLNKAGELYLTRTEKIDRYIRKMWVTRQADFILRAMGFGDTPQRWGAEGATAIQIAVNELGINKTDDIAIEAFMLSPEKYAYNHFVKEGKSTKEASELAKEIKKRIEYEGDKSVLQEENLLSKASELADRGLKSKKEDSPTSKAAKAGGAILKTLTFPFVKIPANAYWNTIKAVNPQLTLAYAVSQAAVAAKYRKEGNMAKANEYANKSSHNASLAVVGYGLSIAVSSLIANGLVRSSNDKEKPKKETEGERVFGKQFQINVGNMWGGDDYWVDLSWFGPVGTMIDIKARMHEDDMKAKLKGEEVDDSFLSEITDNATYSLSSGLNSLVFDQAAKTLDMFTNSRGSALDKAGSTFITNTVNNLGNMITGATFTAISKAALPEQAKLKADNVIDGVINNQKQRNLLFRTFAGMPKSRISIWGEPIKNDNSVTGVMAALLGFEKGSENKFGAIIYDDFRKTGDTRFFPNMEDNKISVQGKPAKLTADQEDELNIEIGKMRKAYIQAFVYDKSKYYDGRYYSQIEKDEDKVDALNDIYEMAKETGFKNFLLKHPEFNPSETEIELKKDKSKEKEFKSKYFKKQFD